MSREQIVLTREELDLQQEYAQRVRQIYRDRLPRQPLACVTTFGCQQNEADSELIRGMLIDMGFGLTDDEREVLSLSRRGKSVVAIGMELGMSTRTVSRRRADIMRKINI